MKDAYTLADIDGTEAGIAVAIFMDMEEPYPAGTSESCTFREPWYVDPFTSAREWAEGLERNSSIRRPEWAILANLRARFLEGRTTEPTKQDMEDYIAVLNDH